MKRMQDIFQHLELEAEFHISIEGYKKAARGDEYLVQVKWMGLDDDEATLEPVSRVL